MKKLKHKIITGLSLSLVLSIFLSSCKKEEVADFDPIRLFTPTKIDVTSGETQVTLVWPASLFTEGKQVSYTVEVAKDSLFSTIDHTVTVDSPFAVITDDVLVLKQKYVARVKANALNSTPESKWVISPGFSIQGEQIFLPIVQTEVKDKTAILRWRPTPELTKIVLTPAGGAAVDVAITADDITAAEKQLTNLTSSTAYSAEIFAGNKSKGITSFTTKEPSIFTVTITPADDLNLAITNAANNDVIGLEPGTYDYSASNIVITSKHVTIQSVSGNPKNTKINFKEITIKGTGAGVKLSGLEFDGTTAGADYFLNFVGLNSDGEAADFKTIVVENSLIHNTDNCLIRANRAGNNAHKIELIKFDNCIAYNNGASTYNYITLDKAEFQKLEITNSTFYNVARAFISWATNITGAKPTVIINQCTINSFGFAGRNNILFDANANPVDFTMRNSILANIPKPAETVGTSLLRAAGGGEIKFTNNNYFNLTTGATPAVPLEFPAYVELSANKTIDLGWNATTSDFTLPAASELKTAGTTGGAIGDLRWAF